MSENNGQPSQSSSGNDGRADCIVVGGGITGLALARHLLDQRPDWRILVLESDARAGGTIRTDRIAGCLGEGGPNGFLDNVPHALDLAHGLGLGSRIRASEPAAARRFLWMRGALRELPLSPAAFLTNDLLSVRGRLRVLREPFVPAKNNGTRDESVHDFVKRRAGREAAAVLADALVSGIFAGDAATLSARAAFPKMVEMEERHGSLMKGMAAAARERRKTGAPRRAPRLHSFDQGMEVLVRALAEKLGSRLRLGTSVERIVPDGGEIRVSARRDDTPLVLSAPRVVVATPAHAAREMLRESLPRVAAKLSEIPYAGLTVACLVYDRKQVRHPLDGFGFLVPRGQGPRMLGCIWAGSLFPDHVPPESALFRVMVGGARDPEGALLAEGRTVDIAQSELERILGVEGAPKEARVYRHARGIPQYVLGHLERVEALERELAAVPGLYLAGNAYKGVGVNDCAREASLLSGVVSAGTLALSPARHA